MNEKWTEEQIAWHLKAYEAWLRNGKTEPEGFQMLLCGMWTYDCGGNDWSGVSLYRLKPQPKWRPFRTIYEVPFGAWVRNANAMEPISCAISHDGIRVNGMPPENIFKIMEMTTDNGKTWTPCGVREDA